MTKSYEPLEPWGLFPPKSTNLGYYVTRQNDGRRTYLTLTGEWTENRGKAERYRQHDLAVQAAMQFPNAFVRTFNSGRTDR